MTLPAGPGAGSRPRRSAPAPAPAAAPAALPAPAPGRASAWAAVPGRELPRRRGTRAEVAARQILEAAGYRVVEANYACRGGEVDLVCRQGMAWVFVEVRARARMDWGTAAETVTALKRHRIVRAARHYLVRHRLGDVDWRVALVAISLDAQGNVADHEILPSIVEDIPGL